MTMRALGKRIAALENVAAGPGIVCIFKSDGENADAVLAAWIAANGALGQRTPVIADAVDAAL